MRKEKKFSLLLRLVGGVSTLTFVIAFLLLVFSGPSLLSGGLLAASATGLFIPCVWIGGSLVEMMGTLLELILESIGSLVEAVLSALASLFS